MVADACRFPHDETFAKAVIGTSYKAYKDMDLVTLVDNAAKYSPPGTTIRVKAAPGNNETMKLSVEDEGPGISAETRERVFDKFFRAMRDGDVGDRKSGSGMGLAIARGIVEAHGGRIWIEDAAGHSGAKFFVELPTGD